MVLINSLTIDEINAALLHLQRSKDETVGGVKGDTVQNVTINNKGGGNTVDYAPTIELLSERIDKNEEDIKDVDKEIDKIKNALEGLASNGVVSLTFDNLTRNLTLYTEENEYTVTITSDAVTLSFDNATNKLTLTYGEDSYTVTFPYINAGEKGVANGVATLDASGRVPYSQLPESAMEFLGNWDASTNTPHLQDGTGTNGDFYVCNVGGTVIFGTGNTQTFVPNDRVIYNGTSLQWVKLPAGQVISVNGQSGEVVLTGESINYSTASGSPTIKSKIDSVQQSAETQSDWTQTNSSAISFIKNKPTIPAAQIQSDWSQTDNTKKDFIKNKPTIPAAQVNADWNATTGVAKILNKPTIPAAQIQSDWTQTDNTKKDFIKNKIPIWITSGSADDNMSPIDSVTNGSMRPITSNAVARGTIQYLGWASYSGNTLGEVVLIAMNSLPIIYNAKNNVYSFRGSWAGHGYFQALVSNPRTINNLKFNVFVQYSTASADMSNSADGDYIVQVLYNENNTPRFSLLSEQKIIAENDTEPYLKIVYSTSVSVTINANTSQAVSIPFEIPRGYKALGYVGLVTSGAAGAINWYSYGAANIAGKTGNFNQDIYFRNYTNASATASIWVSVLCCKA